MPRHEFLGPTFAGKECQHGRCEEGPEDANKDNVTESRPAECRHGLRTSYQQSKNIDPMWAKAYRTTKDPEGYDNTLDFHMVANYLWKIAS
jgi:hypothetical protein